MVSYRSLDTCLGSLYLSKGPGEHLSHAEALFTARLDAEDRRRTRWTTADDFNKSGHQACEEGAPIPGYSLVCRSCWHLSGAECNGPNVTCPENGVCVAALSSVSVGASVTPQYSLSCGTQNECDRSSSLTFNYGTVRTATSCCSTDSCVPTLPTLPSPSSEKNGLTCRTCSSDSSDYCYTSETLQCTGKETKCGRMARTLSGTINLKDAIRGCATSSFCDILGTQNTVIDGLYVDMKTYCSDGAAGLTAGYFISIFTALVTKLLI
ncbi:phospholipase A2 inhibitor and Ly6/PLAUR domain-containing protein-like [Hyla sarda]|uniref:phospholipase A2 inhibitor and Ly6/PLAUR domain-containing protein-like n=1 Tax=Hyla sarda TaxID=327740 RepID=UPI0024C3D93D|nr:phospholipase A2 inhibitor and Ly6/PLAUR domain-containing protein-like [Hyla sarda]